MSRTEPTRRWALLPAHMYVLSPLSLLLVWELATRVGVLDPRFFPGPLSVSARLYEIALSGELGVNVVISTRRVLVGLILGGVPGFLLGIAMALSRTVHMVLNPLVAMLYPIPKTAILPLLMLIFGIGDASKIVAIAIGAFFLILMNTYLGVSSIPPVFLDVCRLFKVSRLHRYRYVVVPGALPGIFIGLKLATGYSVVLMVAAEFVGANSGVGHMIWESWESFDIRGMYAGLIVVSLMGYFATLAVDLLEKRFVPWRSVTAVTGVL